MRRAVLLLVIVAGLFVAPVALAAKDYSADCFDVDIAIQSDGSALITETVVFRFVGGPFITVFRELTADETDGIDEVAAAMDGRVLPVGGVREKVLAAHRAGLKTVILPEKNMKDLVEVPKTAKTELKIIPVKHMDDVLDIALSKDVMIPPPRPRKPAREENQDDE